MPWGTKEQIAKKSTPTIKWGKPYPTRKWAFKAKGKDGKPVSGWTKGKDVSNIKKNTWGQFSFEEQVFSQVSYILIFFHLMLILANQISYHSISFNINQ